MLKTLLALKKKVDLDPSAFDLWGYFNPETGKTRPARVMCGGAPQFEKLEKTQDGKAVVGTVAVKMKYEDFFAAIIME